MLADKFSKAGAKNTDHPTWLWHLIVDFSEGWGHLGRGKVIGNHNFYSDRESENKHLEMPQ